MVLLLYIDEVNVYEIDRGDLQIATHIVYNYLYKKEKRNDWVHTT